MRWVIDFQKVPQIMYLVSTKEYIQFQNERIRRLGIEIETNTKMILLITHIMSEEIRIISLNKSNIVFNCLPEKF